MSSIETSIYRSSSRKMNSLSFSLLVWLFVFHLPGTLSAPHLTVERRSTPSGPEVKSNGATFIGSTDDNYGVSIWLGIRYAKPPIGSLRLQPPEKVDNDGTIVTQSFGAQCFQMDIPSNTNISEDCLFLNIYRPSKAALKENGDGDNDDDDDESSDSLPVMFWIHGGGFNDGSGQIYDSRSLVNTSVALKTPTLVVTINYRLSFFGFSGTLRHPHIVLKFTR
jgi:carboxylesterase type B